MTTVNIQDRRQFAQDKIAEMAKLPGTKQAIALRKIASEVLGFIPVSDTIVAADNDQLPDAATVIGTLPNDFGPDYTAIHFDLSDLASTRSYITNARIQAANRVVQQLAGEEQYPLLMFTLPDNSGVQFVTGNPSPTNRDRLQEVIRVTAYWDSLNRTTLDCLERVGNGVANGEPPQHAFKAGFNVKPITDEFFSDYKSAYDYAVAQLATTINRADAEKFAQTLFNRLLFIHFVSKKSWLSFNGKHDYLNALWRDYQATSNETNFYLQRLSILFFEGLNNPESSDLPAIGDVPFLNGGLFEQTELDTQALDGAFSVPDEIIEPVLTQLFNGYNFTVMESTPLDEEVAVDPEMLGKLFEESVNERHSNGAYYTPRRVVSFMCREAIKGYLAGIGMAQLTDDNISDLVDRANPQAITVAQALEIANAVANLRAVDPACGSGAFLLGMLQEILALNATLFQAGKTPESLFWQKMNIISNTIYGADKDGLAVSTAMLRLWLSLAVDYEGDELPDPLPNLDLKLVVGDTIAGPDPRTWDFTHKLIEESTLRQDIVAYTMAHGQDKADLKERVEETKGALRDNMQDAAPAGEVEWRIDFADVMVNGGFDVVIGNPPYIQLQRNGGELANLYRNVKYESFARTGDIYQLFFERGCQLLKPNQGILAYITSNSWLKAEYGKTTRRYVAESHTPVLLLEMGKDVFDEAIVDTSVLLLKQGQGDNYNDLSVRAVDIDHLEGSFFPPPTEQWGWTRPNGDAPWSILTKTEQGIMDKMLTVGTPLKEWDIAINYGIKTGFNEAFIIDNPTKDALIAEDPKSAEIIKPVLRGRDIQRYQAQWKGMYLIATFPALGLNIENYPAVKRYLLSFGKQRLEQSGKRLPNGSRSRKKTGNAWFELQDTCAYHEDFRREKLFWADMASNGRFALSEKETYCNNKGYIMTGNSLKYLCAVLNSSIITWWVRNMAATTGMGLTEWTIVTVERLPIPKIGPDRQAPLVKLIDRILQLADTSRRDTMDLEAKLDGLVYDLYGLTEEEVRAISGR